MKTYFFIRKFKLQSRIVILYISLLLTNNTIEAQWAQLGQNVFNESQSFGSVSLNVDGSVLAIGVPQDRFSNSNGYARIYRNNNDVWAQIGQDIVGEALGDAFGKSISLSSDGSIVAIGAPGNDGNYVGSGHVRVFQNINDVWTQLGNDIDGGKGSSEINGIELGDFSGLSVSLNADGSVVAIGAMLSGDNGFQSGIVKMYQYNNDSWLLKGSAILGENEEDLSGVSVSLSENGSLVAIGAHGNDENGTNAGHVRIFEYNNTDWVQVGLNINGEAGEASGINVSLSKDGAIVAVGANNSKYTRVYRNINNVWTQIGEDILVYSLNSKGRVEVSLNNDGAYLFAGMPNAFSNQGYGRLYKNNNDSWLQINDQIIGGQTADYFGTTVDINNDGSAIVIGGLGNNSSGIGMGLVKVFQNEAVLSTNEFSNLAVSIYPNPTNNFLNINSKYPIEKVEIYSILGKKVFESKTTSTIILDKLSSGMYLVKIRSNNSFFSKRLMIN